MKIIKKILQILLWTIVIVIALYSSTIIIQKIVMKNKTPSFFGYKNFIVLTGSMEPALNIGDVVFVKESDDIKINDIISFRVENSVVTHRVVEIREDNGSFFYITKGDANSGKDTEVLNINEIEGKYCFKIPFLGKIIMFLKKPIGMLSLLILLGIILFINMMRPKKKLKMYM